MGTARVRVTLSPRRDRSYDILVREGLLDGLADATGLLEDATSVFIVTDSNVARIYAPQVKEGLSRPGRTAEVVVFPSGEANKNIETAWSLASSLSGLGADRSSVLIALGGGVAGDLTGFVASVFKRGIGYVQVPTTLLAQVDSSIGGKTGIDAPWGKNQVGTFHQPLGVLTDPLALNTLPRAEMLNGFAEVVKCSIVADRKMFEEASATADPGAAISTELILHACKIKAEIVSKDEEETNLRAVLNFGHTVGHALESASNYRLSHGSCVFLGMLAEGWIASRLGILDRGELERLEGFLVPLTDSLEGPEPFDKPRLLRFALADKKSAASTIRMSLPARIGKMHATEDGSYKIPVDKETFGASLDYLRRVTTRG